MTRPSFGDPRAIAAARGLERHVGQMAGVPLVVICQSPRATRAWIEAGRPGPCYRCIAYAPGTPGGCHFVNRGAEPAPPAPPAPTGGLW